MAPDDARPELTRRWLAFAADDLEPADRASQAPPLPSVIAFHAQQAAEKALKAFLFWHDRPFRKTHLLAELLSSVRN